MTDERSRWDQELAALAQPAPLLQSWAWGEVQSRSGWHVERVRLSGGALASVQLRSVGPAREAYVPRGPVPATADAIDALCHWAREARVSRLTVEPEAPVQLVVALRGLGFAPAESVQPRFTRLLRLRAPADTEMVPTFRHGRRYNIRAGQRRGVTVEEGAEAAELARQSAAVERRESIHLPDAHYYSTLLELLPWCRTYVAVSADAREPLAAVLVARHADRAYSLYAGRSGARSELMGNDLAWWWAIRSAAEAGCADFDLWGVPPPDAGPDHPWRGLGAFKAEFGGELVEYAGAWELVLSASGASVLAAERHARRVVRTLKRR